MLVIRRRAGESILIGANVEVQVIETTPTRVKLGIVAPQEVLIMRKEVHLTREENHTAARGVSQEAFGPLLARLRGQG
jgi:carbon storage regulator